jgi:hypothetical protein
VVVAVVPVPLALGVDEDGSALVVLPGADGEGVEPSWARTAWLRERAEKAVRRAITRLMGVRGLMIFG